MNAKTQGKRGSPGLFIGADGGVWDMHGPVDLSRKYEEGYAVVKNSLLKALVEACLAVEASNITLSSADWLKAKALVKVASDMAGEHMAESRQREG